MFALRLSPEIQVAVRETAAAVGAANPTEFVRDLISAAVVGDPEKLGGVTERIYTLRTNQLSLALRATGTRKLAYKAPKSKGQVKAYVRPKRP